MGMCVWHHVQSIAPEGGGQMMNDDFCSATNRIFLNGADKTVLGWVLWRMDGICSGDMADLRYVSIFKLGGILKVPSGRCEGQQV